MNRFVHLRQFRAAELLLTEEETRTVLKFVFPPQDHGLIASLPCRDALRGFAQALLVEAIDASCAVGYVEALFRSTANPTAGAVAILKAFGKKAARHWFKHATARDLIDVRVYQFVLDELARRFKSDLHSKFVSVDEREWQFGAFLAYDKPVARYQIVWG